MLKNVGPADRAVRVIVGAVIAFLIVMGPVEGWFAILLGAFAAVMLISGLTGHCLAYRAMDMDTRNHEDAYKQLDESI